MTRAQDIDPDCPRTLEERLVCAVRRMCGDYAIVGTRRSIPDVLDRLTTLMGCAYACPAVRASQSARAGGWLAKAPAPCRSSR